MPQQWTQFTAVFDGHDHVWPYCLDLVTFEHTSWTSHKASGVDDDIGGLRCVHQLPHSDYHRQQMPGRARRANKIPGNRCHLSQGLGHLGIPQGQRCWWAKVFLPHIRIDHCHAPAGLQAAPDEKATIRALATINGAKDEDFPPPVAHNLVCRPVPGWRNIER